MSWIPVDNITASSYGAASAVHAIYFEPPRPCLSFLIVKANRRRGKPRAAMRAITTGDPRVEWYSVYDEARREVHTMTPDETYLLCCLLVELSSAIEAA
jgi:hypothetical protein